MLSEKKIRDLVLTHNQKYESDLNSVLIYKKKKLLLADYCHHDEVPRETKLVTEKFKVLIT